MPYLSQRLAKKPPRAAHRLSVADPLAESQRQRLLDAAERLVGERGCSGTSIEAIAGAAHVSTASFYEHFDGKEACFVAAFDRAVEEERAELERTVRGLPWPEQVSTALRALLARVAAEPARARLCLVEAQTGGPALSARFEALLDRVAARLREGRTLKTAPAALPATHEEATAGALAWLVRERLERAWLPRGGSEAGVGGDRVEALYPELVNLALGPYLGDGSRGLDHAMAEVAGQGDG